MDVVLDLLWDLMASSSLPSQAVRALVEELANDGGRALVDGALGGVGRMPSNLEPLVDGASGLDGTLDEGPPWL
eukprot:12490952-Alexandrium_andersonii.AAC.1